MRVPSAAIALVIAAALVAACLGGNATEPSVEATTSIETTPEANATASPSPASASLPPIETPAPSPSDSESPSPSSAPLSGEACSGTDLNRDFYRQAAAAVSWDVYCPVLPAGWNVENGSYRGAGGGRMEISYKGPLGARFELHEGAFCQEADGCVPNGLDLGPSPFGDQTGTLIAADDGSWAIIVDAGDPISWMAVGSAIDEDVFRAVTAGLLIVVD